MSIESALSFPAVDLASHWGLRLPSVDRADRGFEDRSPAPVSPYHEYDGELLDSDPVDEEMRVWQRREMERQARARELAALRRLDRFAPLIEDARRGNLPTFPEPGEPYSIVSGVTVRDLNRCVQALARTVRYAIDRLDVPLWEGVCEARLAEIASIAGYVSDLQRERG